MCWSESKWNLGIYYLNIVLKRCTFSSGKNIHEGLINVFLLFLPFLEFMPLDSECEEELQEECGLSQLETRLQHGPDHVHPAEVRTPTGQPITAQDQLIRVTAFYSNPKSWIRYRCFNAISFVCMLHLSSTDLTCFTATQNISLSAFHRELDMLIWKKIQCC